MYQFIYNTCLDGCKACTNSISCSECSEKSDFKVGMKCISPCLSNQFITGGICTICDPSCATCFGPSSSHCMSCSAGFYLTNSFTCISSCNTGTLILNLLFNSCIDLAAQFSCSAIDASHQCTSCESGYTLDSFNNCVSSTNGCPFGYYVLVYVCIAYPANCIVYDGTCKVCQRGYQLNSSYGCQPMTFNSLGVAGPSWQSDYILDISNVPSDYYFNSKKNMMQACDVSCSTCSGPTPYDCTTCSSGGLFDGFCREVCTDNYYYSFDDATCIGCSSECSSCFDTTDDSCWACNTSYLLYENTCGSSCPSPTLEDNSLNKCYLPCPSNCLTCYSLNTCDYCSPGYEITSTGCAYQFNISQTDSKDNKITISLDTSTLIDLKELQQNILFSFNPNIDFSVSFTNQSETQLLATFTFIKIPPSVLYLTTSISKIIEASTSSQRTVQVKFTYSVDQSTEAVTDTVSTANKGITKSIMASAFIFVLTSYFPMLSSLVDLSELFYLLLFLDFVKPYNLEEFISSFEDIQMVFLPNSFKIILGKFPHETTEPLFNEAGETGFFLENAGSATSMIFLLLIIHFVLYILYSRFSIHKSLKLQNFAKIGLDHINKTSYLQILEIIYMQIVYSCFLQFKNLEISSFVESINLMLLILSLILIVPLPSAIYMILKTERFARFHQQLRAYFEQMKFPECRFLIYTRKLIFGIVIIIMYGLPYVQIPILIVATVTLPCFILFKKPYEKQFLNKKAVLIEILFAICIILLLPLLDPQIMVESKRQGISWGLICSFCLIIFIEIVSLFLNIFKQLKQFLEKRKRNKVYVFNKETPAIAQKDMEKQKIDLTAAHESHNISIHSPNLSFNSKQSSPPHRLIQMPSQQLDIKLSENKLFEERTKRRSSHKQNRDLGSMFSNDGILIHQSETEKESLDSSPLQTPSTVMPSKQSLKMRQRVIKLQAAYPDFSSKLAMLSKKSAS